MVCVATSFSSRHEYEPGTAKERRRLEEDCWEVCGKPKKHKIHKLDD